MRQKSMLMLQPSLNVFVQMLQCTLYSFCFQYIPSRVDTIVVRNLLNYWAGMNMLCNTEMLYTQVRYKYIFFSYFSVVAVQ